MYPNFLFACLIVLASCLGTKKSKSTPSPSNPGSSTSSSSGVQAAPVPPAPASGEIRAFVYVNSKSSLAAEILANMPRLNINGAITIRSANLNQGPVYASNNQIYYFSVEELDLAHVMLGRHSPPVVVVKANKVVIGLGPNETKLDLTAAKHESKEVGHQVYVGISGAPYPNPYRGGVLVIPTSGSGVERGPIASMLPERTIMVYELKDRQLNLLRKYTFVITADQDIAVEVEGPTGPAAVTASYEKVGLNYYTYIRTVTVKE